MALATVFEEAAQERANAAIRNAEARATLIVQEAEGEAAFRRLHDYLGSIGELTGQRLSEEMDAEFRVQGMMADEALAVSASSLLTAQVRIGTLEIAVIAQDAARVELQRMSNEADVATRELIDAFRVELTLKDQIIIEQQRALAPSFFQKLFDMPEVALFGAVFGAGLAYVAIN